MTCNVLIQTVMTCNVLMQTVIICYVLIQTVMICNVLIQTVMACNVALVFYLCPFSTTRSICSPASLKLTCVPSVTFNATYSCSYPQILSLKFRVHIHV